jgi:hypothetical protein
MDFTEYDLLRSRLPKTYQSFKVIIDLDNGYLRIRVVPGHLDGATATAWNQTILNCANNPLPLPGVLSPLRSIGEAGDILFYLGLLT